MIRTTDERRQLAVAMKEFVQAIANSRHHIMTQANRESYLNTSWRLITQYEKEKT